MSESPADGAVPCHDPVFILTASRSGSTLLRFILDTHPDFACPPETMITAACVALFRSCDILENAGSGRQRLLTEGTTVPEEVLATVRGTVDQVFGRYLARRGKPRWCDKSLDSIFNADLLAQIYPRARFICLYRHCMDVIASGVEVCPWGVSRFGFDGYVAQHPGNSVAAIGSYWNDCARAMLTFEEQQPGRCHRLRYEDLVSAPEEAAAGVFDFLGARVVPGITDACFSTPHEGDGPGDEKIWFTTKITAEALGRGVRVPAGALPGQLREQINELLGKLGYRAVTNSWNDSTTPQDPRLPRQGAPPAGVGPDSRDHSGRPGIGTEPTADAAFRALADRISAHSGQERTGSIAARWPDLAGQSIRFVVAGREEADLIWTFPAEAGPGTDARADDPVATMIAEPAAWLALLDGRANMITEIRAGRLRCVNRRDAFRVRSDEIHAIASLLGIAQVPLVYATS
ncbi:MAG: sulfotransferase [Streptosporangiaceae bacterium]